MSVIAAHSMLMVPMSSVSSHNRPYSSCRISPVTRSPFFSVITSVLSRWAFAGTAHSRKDAASSPLSSGVRMAFILFLRRDRLPRQSVTTGSCPHIQRRARLLLDQRNLFRDAEVLHRVELALDLKEARHAS